MLSTNDSLLLSPLPYFLFLIFCFLFPIAYLLVNYTKFPGKITSFTGEKPMATLPAGDRFVPV